MKPQDFSPYANHEEVWSLLPWYINGSLKAAQLDMVRSHLRVCLTCRKELAAQETLFNALRHEPVLEISTKPSFDRLMSRIQEEERSAEPAKRHSKHGEARWLNRLAWMLEVFTPQRLGLALAGGLVALTIPLIWQHTRLAETHTYHTVANPGSLDAYTNHDVRVIFTPTANEQEIGQFLQSIHARIVEGPSAIGLYTIRVDGEKSATPLSQTLVKLRDNKSVAFAEPALPQATR